jgi:ABC-2 type transport system permease protein
VTSWVAIAVYSLLVMAISAWVKWRLAAGAALFGTFMISNTVGMAINGLFSTNLGSFFSLTLVMNTIRDSLFGTDNWNSLDLPPFMLLSVPAAWTSLALLCGLCLLLLSRRIRAYEVVK